MLSRSLFPTKKASFFTVFAAIAFALASFQIFTSYAASGNPNSEDTNRSRYPVVVVRPVADQYNYGGIMSFPSGDEVATYLESYDISGEAEITLYKASEQNLLNYLLHDDKRSQKERNMSVADFPVVATIRQRVTEGYDNKVLVKLPITEATGIWYFTVRLGNVTNNGFILKSSFGVTALEEKEAYLFWAQDFNTHRSAPGVEVTVYSLLNERKELGRANTNDQGIARTSFSAVADVALAKRGNEYALIPLNLTSLNTSYNYTRFDGRHRRGKYFIFTDRPIYKPGDTVYFKAIVRDTEGAGYFIPQEMVRVYIGGFEDPMFDRNFTVSELGTIDGEYTLPKDTSPGGYDLTVSLPASEMRQGYDQSSLYFQVEEYRKPEYFLEVASSQSQVIVGEPLEVDITGTFFSGHPAAGYDVSYTVTSSDWYDYQYQTSFDDSVMRYGQFYGSHEAEDTVQLDQKGTYKLTINTKILTQKPHANRLVSVGVSMKDNSGNVSTRYKNFLVYAADYTAYLSDQSKYGFRVGREQGEVNYVLKVNSPKIPKESVTLTYSVVRSTWEPTGKKGSSGYEEYIERKFPVVNKKTIAISPSQFSAVQIQFPIDKAGSYQVDATFTDAKGRKYKRNDWVYAYDSSAYYSYSDSGESMSLSLDKRQYLAQDTAHVLANVPYATGDVLFVLGKRNVLTYEVASVSENIAEYGPKLKDEYLPRTTVFAYGFYGRKNLNATAALLFDSTSKHIDVKVRTDKKVYGPGETATVNVTTTDKNSQPVPAEVAVWSMDKSLLELATPASLDIFETFWKTGETSAWGGYYGGEYQWIQSAHSLENINFYEGYGGRGGGCFAAGTMVTMADGTTKPIEDVQSGEQILTLSSSPTGGVIKAKVTGTHTTSARGLLVINGKLHVTPNHILYVNGSWHRAGDIQLGDTLRALNENDEVVKSIEYLDKTVSVYNLTVANEHTYMADGVWVHNQKGDNARSVFKDTAYWNPRLKTNAQGEATVRFTLPDNLTTWVVNAVAVGADTMVGNTAQEVIVTKPVFIRPFVSNTLRMGDHMKLEASIHNFSGSDQTFEYAITAPSLEVKKSKGSIKISDGAIGSVFWDVKAVRASSLAKLTFAATVQGNPKMSDIMEQTVPITDVYLEDDVSDFGMGDKSFTIDIPKNADLSRSTIKLALASSITKTLPQSMDYLISYPYGCTEQTTSRLYALLAAKENPELFEELTKGKNIDEMIEKGIDRLGDLMTNDGGWGYWYVSRSDPFITMYVAILLKRLELAGYDVPQYYPGYDQDFTKNYRKTINKEHVDSQALAMLFDVVVHGKKPDPQVIALIKEKAILVGESVYWEGGDWRNYGSRDATTGLALQALVVAKDSDIDLQTKAIRYLMANKKRAYWSNTFGTVQAAYGILASQKSLPSESEGLPVADSPIPFEVKLDGKTESNGILKPNEDKLITVSIDKMRTSTKHKLNISFAGDSVGYTTVTGHWVYTKPVPSRDAGLTVKKTFTNATDKYKSIGVGDTVNVEIEVKSPKAVGDSYMVVADELPAGMIPINKHLDNEQTPETSIDRYQSYMQTREYTATGIVMGTLGTSTNTNGYETFTYQARVVSEGTFAVPPAKAQLMYLPEVSGHSASDTMRIARAGSVPVLVGIKRSTENLYNEFMIQLKRIYLKVTSPLARIISRQYTDDVLRIVALVFGGYVIWRLVKKTLTKSHHHTPHHMDKLSPDEIQEADEG